MRHCIFRLRRRTAAVLRDTQPAPGRATFHRGPQGSEPHRQSREGAEALRGLPALRRRRCMARRGEQEDRQYPRADELRRRRALAAGFDRHLVKPVDPKVLLHELQVIH